jgi:hypothetical protein
VQGFQSIEKQNNSENKPVTANKEMNLIVKITENKEMEINQIRKTSQTEMCEVFCDWL